MKPTVKQFTKDKPCTKLDIWNCFRSRRGFIPAQVNAAKSIIGANAPRVMEQHKRVRVTSRSNVDYYELTAEGKKWLVRGIKNYVRNHPGDRSKAKHLPANLQRIEA